MQKELVDFYVQFHHAQHYFLCHDILEEAWKARPSFSKTDPVVSLILLATGCYHYRRGNFKGAHRSFKKALNTLQYDHHQNQTLGIQVTSYQKLLQQLITDTEAAVPFTPVQLPLTSEMESMIIKSYPNYTPLTTVVTSPTIVHHHKMRDRSEVIAARQRAQMTKRQNR